MPPKVICPTCQQPVPPEMFYRSLGRVKSRRKARAHVAVTGLRGSPRSF
jgi:hypothetical protein